MMRRAIAVSMAFIAGCVAYAGAAAEPPPRPASLSRLLPLRVPDVGPLYASGRDAPLVVEVWSLDCGYCRENVAHLVEWRRAHPHVRIALVALDPLEEAASQLERALAQMQLPADVLQYGNAEPMPERLRAALDPEWRGELPRTLWIDANGTRRGKSGLLAPAVLDGWLRDAH